MTHRLLSHRHLPALAVDEAAEQPPLLRDVHAGGCTHGLKYSAIKQVSRFRWLPSWSLTVRGEDGQGQPGSPASAL